jgi:hypothetical protein
MQRIALFPGSNTTHVVFWALFPPRHTFRCFFGFSALESKPPRDTIRVWIVRDTDFDRL